MAKSTLGIALLGCGTVGGGVVNILKQQRDGRFKVSLRSRGGHDVAAAAARFGGGGHRLASGYTSSQGLVATIESLKEAIGAEPSIV